MKFGRYLIENQTPEWKRAYIDYRACKKAIKVVAARLDSGQADKHPPNLDQGIPSGDKSSDVDSEDGDVGPSAPPKPSRTTSVREGGKSGSGGIGPISPASTTRRGMFSPRSKSDSKRVQSPGYGATSTSPRNVPAKPTVPPPLDIGESSYTEPTSMPAKSPVTIEHVDAVDSSRLSGQSSDDTKGGMESAGSDPGQHLTASGPSRVRDEPRGMRSPRFLNSPKAGTPKSGGQKSPGVGRRSLRSFTLPSPRTPKGVRTADNFDELYDYLEDDEKAFFDLLANELDKVESFYSARVAEAQRRAHDLRDQLHELAEHRKIFHEIYPEGVPEWEVKVGRLLPVTGSVSVTKQIRKRLPFTEEGTAQPPDPGHDKSTPDDTHREARLREAMMRDPEHHMYSPERYQKYKKDLRNAMMEFYKQLELIKNYRIMNLTGFRKALKKFEKTSKIHCLEMYTDERVNKCSFARGKVIDDLITQMENLYTQHFEHGDSKKARDRLRRQQREKTHYLSVFRSGIMMGLALPPAVLALEKACEEETRSVLAGWDGLLQIYGGFYIAVIFSLLFQLNLTAWVGARINYEFVMELSNPTLDYRSYTEIPAFLFMTLSYCFFFTFYRVSPNVVHPTTWPLAWLIFVIVFFLNPLNIFRRRSRYWFLRVLFRVCTPGYSRVEFIAFFLADELNSLIYSIQNFYFMGCLYSRHFPRETYSVCPSGNRWPYAILLCLPALSRLIQCIKRWRDSGLHIHLINAGKYLCSIAQLCMFVVWRARGRSLTDPSFIVWVIVSIITSTYTSAWDLIIDWSLFRQGSGMLRRDRGYSSPYVYYFAMASNILIRFIWVFYIPDAKHFTNSRSFYFSLAEMLRRWQWNFFRVETEHLGNADAYRVTREIPLPYRRVEHDSEDDEPRSSLERGGSKRNGTISLHLDRIRRGLAGQDEAAENTGVPKVRQRNWEARRVAEDDHNPAQA